MLPAARSPVGGSSRVGLSARRGGHGGPGRRSPCDDGGDRHGAHRADRALAPYVVALLVLAVVRGVLTFFYRRLFKTAYALEYDLRNIIYEHLTQLSFSFYDRVQSGQLISRANSDIRSVQMFLAFAPIMALVLVQRSSSRFALMLTINVPLALVALATLPFVYVVGVRDARAACSRSRGSSRRAWPTSPPSSTRTSTASGS